jgi:hypothetical protein
MKSKVILNMYICDYESPNWKENVELLNSIEFPTSIPTSGGHHRGLAIQVLLDLNIEEAEEFATVLLTTFKDDPTIVIAEVEVKMKNSPIGYYFDQDLWEPGRYFDKLISQGKKGLYIHTKDMPKVNKYE